MHLATLAVFIVLLLQQNNSDAIQVFHSKTISGSALPIKYIEIDNMNYSSTKHLNNFLNDSSLLYTSYVTSPTILLREHIQYHDLYHNKNVPIYSTHTIPSHISNANSYHKNIKRSIASSFSNTTVNDKNKKYLYVNSNPTYFNSFSGSLENTAKRNTRNRDLRDVAEKGPKQSLVEQMSVTRKIEEYDESYNAPMYPPLGTLGPYGEQWYPTEYKNNHRKLDR